MVIDEHWISLINPISLLKHVADANEEKPKHFYVVFAELRKWKHVPITYCVEHSFPTNAFLLYFWCLGCMYVGTGKKMKIQPVGCV